MNRLPILSLAILFAFFLSPPVFAGNGGAGGGHSSGGGHGGAHFGGGVHSAGGGSSGHSFGHSVGHSLGRIFGHRSGGRSSRTGKNPGGRGENLPHFTAVSSFHHPMRRRVRFRNGFFNSGLCDSVRFSWHNFLSPGDFDCFGGNFFFDPFLFGTDFWSDSLDNSGALPEPPDSSGEAAAPSPGDATSAAPSVLKVKQPIALLQLLDGSMYGLTRYWIEGTSLHYVTNYGGENSVPLDRVDFANTARLNAAQGTSLDLTRNVGKP